MRDHTTRRSFVAAAVLLAAFAVPVALTAPAAGDDATRPAFTVADATLEPNGTATVRVVLTRAPGGLSGFDATLELAAGGAARVTGASYPEACRPTTEPVVSADDRSVDVKAADLSDAVTPGATDVTLATVRISGVAPGTTKLRVTDLQVDADDGGKVRPAPKSGTVTVASGNAAVRTGTDGAGRRTGPRPNHRRERAVSRRTGRVTDSVSPVPPRRCSLSPRSSGSEADAAALSRRRRRPPGRR